MFNCISEQKVEQTSWVFVFMYWFLSYVRLVAAAQQQPRKVLQLTGVND